ncbi:MAG: hypothetical protein IPJ88_15390 [Myxococcales bacterium]|nr:MAG: hypothetical protein IPJ88_15390 [Myxococcales bacterium]
MTSNALDRRPSIDLDVNELNEKFQSLIFFDDLNLSMQGHYLSLTDMRITRMEYEVAAALANEEKTPFETSEFAAFT